ncbi:helix-turn-helix domain-containing protein [uncultured Treponema sp.]|uniref:helix-turn-helix domain-containing protein n=1 Tax=uncultured Treponema sp. TaxID=162155 RepID=UPI002601585F|nr:helix-turn-helix domain-containing protein [uncultured Treponema sp.]
MKDSEIQARLAENLKRIRKVRKMTQFELAEKAEISDETIKNIELCKTWTSEKTLSRLTEALEIDIHTLFLPIPSSFDKQISEDNQQIKANIIENIREFIETNLKKMEANA